MAASYRLRASARGLDVPPGTRPPQQQHIVLLNRAEVAAAPAPPAEA